MLITKYDYTPINRETINGKRHYCLPDGSKVPSVTTILDLTKSESSRLALSNWRKAVGEKKAQEITTEAASRGTRMHKWLENYVINGSIVAPGSNPYSQQSHKMANTIISNGLCHVNEYWGVEVPLYYSGLYAGTTDCLGVWKGKQAIIDFKQTNKPKVEAYLDDYYCQLSAYMMAHDDMHGTNLECGVILMCVKPAEITPGVWGAPQYQEFVLDGDKLEKYKDIWLEKVAQYYKINS